MHSYSNRFVNPPVQGLDLLKLQLQAPMKWSESYEMYGERHIWVDDSYNLSQYKNYAKFKAKCCLCEQLTEPFNDSGMAIHAHFLHCSEKHGYIFPENYSTALFKVENKALQQTIQLAMEYDLPLPGFEDHENCIKQYRNKRIVCIVHKESKESHEISHW